MNNLKIYTTLIAIILIAAVIFINSTETDINESPNISMDHHEKLFELRTYTTNDGKLDDLHARFANHTMELFEKHGMENIGYWTPVDKENTLIYIVAHDNIEAAEASWDEFRNDPDWQAAYAASREDGPLVVNVESVFMKGTEFSPMK